MNDRKRPRHRRNAGSSRRRQPLWPPQPRASPSRSRLRPPLIQSITKDTLTVYLDHDAQGTPQVLTTDAGVEVYYVFDGTIGNPVALINTSGTVVAAYAYDPYGAYTTTGATGSAAGLNPFRTAGGMYDRTTGWIKYGQRWYNPTTGRFTQQDSIEHLTNPQQGDRYAYAADNPINYIDPTGNDIWSAFTVVGVGIVTGVLGIAFPEFAIPLFIFGTGTGVLDLVCTYFPDGEQPNC